MLGTKLAATRRTLRLENLSPAQPPRGHSQLNQTLIGDFTPMNRRDGGEFVLHTLAARMRAIEGRNGTGPWPDVTSFRGSVAYTWFRIFRVPGGGPGN